MKKRQIQPINATPLIACQFRKTTEILGKGSSLCKHLSDIAVPRVNQDRHVAGEFFKASVSGIYLRVLFLAVSDVAWHPLTNPDAPMHG